MQKESKLWVADNSGGIKAKCIQTYKKKTKPLGQFIKTVLVSFEVEKKLAKKKKYFGLLVCTKKKQRRQCGTWIRFSENRALLFGDVNKFLGSRIFGPIATEIRAASPSAQFKKYKSLAAVCV